jgi:hypothetical protein
MSRTLIGVALSLVLLLCSQSLLAGGLRTVVTAGHLDPVSGEPIAGFGRAVINDNGDVAFEGWLEVDVLDSAGPDLDDNDGLWSTWGGLHRVARENRVMSGAGTDWDSLLTMDMLNSGELIGTCNEYFYGSQSDLRAIWRSHGGTAEVIVDTNDDAGFPQGRIDSFGLGGGLVGRDGTYYYDARRKDLDGVPYTTFAEPFIDTMTTRDFYEGPDVPEEYHLQGTVHSPLPARVLPGGVVEHTAVRSVFEDVEQFPGGPVLSERQGLRVSVWHTDESGPSMQRELPMEAPGVGPDMVFDNVVSAGMNERGWLKIDAYAEKPDGTGMVRGVWAETPAGLELVHANTPENLATYGTVIEQDVVLSDNGVWAYKAGWGLEEELLLDVGGGIKSVVMREGWDVRGLPEGVTVDRILDYAMSSSGQLVVLARHSGREDDGGGGLFEDDTPLPFDDPTVGLWVSNEYWEVEPLLIEGMTLNIAGELKTIHTVHEQAWLDINVHGEMPVALGFTDGSTGLYVVAVPEPTTLAVLGLGGLLALRRGRR